MTLKTVGSVSYTSDDVGSNQAPGWSASDFPDRPVDVHTQWRHGNEADLKRARVLAAEHPGDPLVDWLLDKLTGEVPSD